VVSVWVYIGGALGVMLMLPLLVKASKLKNGFGAINIFVSYAQVGAYTRPLFGST